MPSWEVRCATGPSLRRGREISAPALLPRPCPASPQAEPHRARSLANGARPRCQPGCGARPVGGDGGWSICSGTGHGEGWNCWAWGALYPQGLLSPLPPRPSCIGRVWAPAEQGSRPLGAISPDSPSPSARGRAALARGKVSWWSSPRGAVPLSHPPWSLFTSPQPGALARCLQAPGDPARGASGGIPSPGGAWAAAPAPSNLGRSGPALALAQARVQRSRLLWAGLRCH